MSDRVILIGCGKQKAAAAAPAKSLYQGCLFRARRAYAESSGCSWFILSARHGLLSPRERVEPYDVQMRELCAESARAWGERVWRDLWQWVGADGRRPVVEIQAGDAYLRPLLSTIPADKFNLSWPVMRLGIGHQMRWLREHTKAKAR